MLYTSKILRNYTLDTPSMLSTKHISIHRHNYNYMPISINLDTPSDRLKFTPRISGFCRGIGGRDTTNDYFGMQQHQLFKTIVSNTATTSEKRTMVSSEFINMKTRGKAVSIGPLEYCGNGIPLKNTNRAIM